MILSLFSSQLGWGLDKQANWQTTPNALSPMRIYLARSDRLYDPAQFDYSDPYHRATVTERISDNFEHDNDNLDITEMTVYPTTQEIFCQQPPYLPARRQSDPDATIEAIIEQDFRLTRFEGFIDFKVCCSHAVQHLLDDIITGSLAATYHCYTEVHGRKCWQYRYVQLTRVDLEPISCQPLLTVDISPPSDIGSDIKKTLRLAAGSIVAVIVALSDGSGDVVFDIVFVKVKDCETKKGMVRLQSCWEQSERYQDLAAVVRATWSSDTRPLAVSIVEVSGQLHSSWPMLASRLRRPELITDLKESRFQSPTVVSEVEDPPVGDLDFFNVRRSDLKIDEARLPYPNASTNRDEWIQELVEISELHPSQAAAVFEIFTKTTVVIQGPPGSGKPYFTTTAMEAAFKYPEL